MISRDSKLHNFASSLFLLIIIGSGLLAVTKWSVCMSKSRKSLCILQTDAGLYVYRWFVWSNLNFLHSTLWFTLSIQSCLVLNSFSLNFQHSLNMRLIVLSLSAHNRHLVYLGFFLSSLCHDWFLCCFFMLLLWVLNFSYKVLFSWQYPGFLVLDVTY